MQIDTSFDNQIKLVKGFNLNWLPWIGKDYKKSKNKLLVVGESNYLNEDIDVNEPDYIRKLIEKDGTNEGKWWQENIYIAPRHKKLERILGVDDKDINAKRNFWYQSAYYNLIQEPLKSNKEDDRPHYQLFLDGWNILFQIINIMQPNYCLMNGVESFKYFDESNADKYNFKTVEKNKLEKIGNGFAACPRRIVLKNNITNEIIKMLFIHHTSKIKPNFLELWRDFVGTEIS